MLAKFLGAGEESHAVVGRAPFGLGEAFGAGEGKRFQLGGAFGVVVEELLGVFSMSSRSLRTGPAGCCGWLPKLRRASGRRRGGGEEGFTGFGGGWVWKRLMSLPRRGRGSGSKGGGGW